MAAPSEFDALAGRPRVPRRSGVIVPHQANGWQRLFARLIWLSVCALSATVRVRITDQAGYLSGASATPVIFAVWHNRLALVLSLYARLVQRRQPGRRMAALVSASKDGALLARVLELFQVEPVRGSSSRRGPQALRELVTWGGNGCDLAITPDGPRGPRYSVQEGIVALAQLTGRPILPVAYDLNWKLQLRSWDRFQIPLPFARCHVCTGRLIHVPREASAVEREQLRRQLEDALREITRD